MGLGVGGGGGENSTQSNLKRGILYSEVEIISLPVSDNLCCARPE